MPVPEADERGGEPVWLPVGEAARRLGVTREAIRRRVNRGTLDCRRETKGNRVRLLVRLPVAEPLRERDAPPVGEPLAELRARVAGLEAVVAAQREHIADLRGELAAERARVDALLAAVAEQSERRPWPGLKLWLRRFWEGK